MTDSGMRKIERLVCDSVNRAITQSKPKYGKTVSVDALYGGVTKVPTCVIVARQMCYLVLHDIYGVPYSSISARSGISRRRIMSGIDKARRLSFTDDLYCGIHAHICGKIGISEK